MENILYGILTIVLSTFGYFQAWKLYKKEKYDSALFFVVVSALPLYCFVSADFFLHTWDERYHALVAKNLLKHPLIPTLYDTPILDYDYMSWVSNHVWLHKQPVTLYLIASSLKVFGVNEIAVRIPSIIFSLIAIILTFNIGKYFYNASVGLLAAFLFSINGLIIELTGGRVATDHVDITFMFFILLSIFLAIKQVQVKQPIYLLLLALSISAAILTKWLAAMIVLPVWYFISFDDKRSSTKSRILNLSIVSIIVLILVLPWQLYIFNSFPLEAAYEASFNFKHLTEEIEGRTGSIFYFFNKIRINFGELIYLPIIWFFMSLFRKGFSFKKIALAVWFLVPFLIFSIAETKMQAYLLFTAPALFIISASFFFNLIDYKIQFKKKWLINIVLVLLIALPIRYSIERIKPFEVRDRSPKWVQEIKNLNKNQPPIGVLLNYHSPIEAMFYTNYTVYSELPSNDEIVRLRDTGLNIIISDNNLPKRVLSIKGIQILSFHKRYKITLYPTLT